MESDVKSFVWAAILAALLSFLSVLLIAVLSIVSPHSVDLGQNAIVIGLAGLTAAVLSTRA